MRLALNHWKLAIETHGANFPKVDHVCEDISAVDPRRYASTDILITSPECTNHSLAKGARRKNQGQREMFKPVDPSVERSRATMWDVVRFAEFHRYRIIIVENVVDVRMWELWDAWLLAMGQLGYLHKLVSLNSMFCHPTPQSRDRAYIVFWKKGNRAPDLEVRPKAPCAWCGDVEAVQTWKRNSASGMPNDAGRYKRQYVFTCSRCRREVTPYYYAALNAIDWSLPATRIGDRPKALKERTLERIRYGLEKYGRKALILTTNMTTDSGRVRSVDEPGFTQTGSALTALCSPFVVETTFTSDGERRVSGGLDPLPTQSTRQAFGVAMPFLACAGSRETAPSGGDEPIPTLTGSDRFGVVTSQPFMVQLRHSSGLGYRVKSVADPLGTLTASESPEMGVVTPPPFLVKMRGTQDGQMASTPVGADEPLGTFSAGGIHHAVVQGAALLTMRDQPNLQLSEVTDPLYTQTASAQASLIQRTPFLVQYYGQNQASGMHEGLPTVTGLDRHALVDPRESLAVEDLYFRMMVPHELKAGMAFPSTYKILGNNREQVKQIGNAVTPPAMAWLIRRCVASLHPEVMA